jgi:hypothetical protein
MPFKDAVQRAGGESCSRRELVPVKNYSRVLPAEDMFRRPLVTQKRISGSGLSGAEGESFPPVGKRVYTHTQLV